MIILALLLLAVGVAASGWSAAYAWTATLPSLMWLQRERQYDAWWESIDAMHEHLDALSAS